MIKYSIASPNERPTKFKEYKWEIGILEWMNIYELIEENEHESYDSIIVYSPVDLDEESLKIIPFRRYCDDYYVLHLGNFITKSEIKKFRRVCNFFFSTTLSFVDYLPVQGRTYTSFDGDTKVVDNFTIKRITKDRYKSIVSFYNRYQKVSEEIQNLEITKEQLRKLQEIDSITPINSVIAELNYKLQENDFVHPQLGILYTTVPNGIMWSSLMFCYLYFNRNIAKMIRFFNETFLSRIDEIGYNDDASDLGIVDGGWFWDAASTFRRIENNYFSGDAHISDFIIKVQYKIKRQDESMQYIVTLIGEKVVSDVEFPITSNKIKFKDAFAKYGNFHFRWGDSLAQALHSAVTSVPAPMIDTLVGVWFHWDIVVASNCIYDFKKHKLYDREWRFFFSEDTKVWFNIEDCRWQQANSTITSIPSLNLGYTKREPQEYYDFFSGFYKSDHWKFLYIYMLWMVSYWVFRKQRKFPGLILNWLFGSGKSSFSDIIKKVYGYGDTDTAQKQFGNISNFVLTRLFADYKWFPVFLTEFKEWRDTSSKVEQLVSLYDKSSVSKWFFDQSVFNYEYAAIPIIDWEELPWRSALRSRAYIIEMSNQYKISGPEYAERIASPILKDFLMDVLTHSDYSNFDKYFSAWHAIVEWVTKSERMRDNFCILYAAAMCFSPELQEDFLKVLLHFTSQQREIEDSTSGIAEMLRFIATHGRKLEYDGIIFVQWQDFCIKLDELRWYFERGRFQLSLWFDAIVKYFPRTWFIEVDHQGMFNCAMYRLDDTCPKELLFMRDAYTTWKSIKTWKPKDPF